MDRDGLLDPDGLRRGVAILLSGVGGFVDAVGWLALRHVFAAQVSGNTILVATHWVAGQDAAAALQAFTIALFFAGLIAGGVGIEIGKRRRLRRLIAPAMVFEAALLLLFMAAGGTLLAPHAGAATPRWLLYLLVAFVALAMGVQNTALRMAGVVGVYTTHVTGTITNLSEELVVWLFASADRAAGGGPRVKDAPRLAKLFLTGGLCLAFFIGALAASFLLPAIGLRRSLALPVAAVLLVGLIDWCRPLARLEPQKL